MSAERVWAWMSAGGGKEDLKTHALARDVIFPVPPQVEVLPTHSVRTSTGKRSVTE